MSGGVADYVALLGRELVRHGFVQRYVVTGAANGRRPTARLFAGRDDVRLLTSPCAAELAATLVDLRPAAVLLHYSGYGFARRGAPLWLVRGLRTWKRVQPQARLVTMFHETWACSRLPWQSSFWLSAVQRSCVRQIAGFTDTAVTSTSTYAQSVRPFLPEGTPLYVQPIFSNVGEPEAVPPFAERDPVAVVFGLAGHRRRLWQTFRPWFDRLPGLGIERLVEIGAEPEATRHLEWPLPTERLGRLSAAEVSARLLRARFGLIDCDPARITGSGVFSAFAAHGVIPVTTWNSRDLTDSKCGSWIICLGDRADLPPGPHATTAAHRWYEPHRAARQVGDVWCRLLGAAATGES